MAATKKAVELAAYFSINAASLKNREALEHVPLDRILAETDHPTPTDGQPSPDNQVTSPWLRPTLHAATHHCGRPATEVLDEPLRARGIDWHPGPAPLARARHPSRGVTTQGKRHGVSQLTPQSKRWISATK